MVQDVLVISIEQRFGDVQQLPHTVEWLTDNGSCYIADETLSATMPNHSALKSEPQPFAARKAMAWLKRS